MTRHLFFHTQEVTQPGIFTLPSESLLISPLCSLGPLISLWGPHESNSLIKHPEPLPRVSCSLHHECTSFLALLAQSSPAHSQEPLTHSPTTTATASTVTTCREWERSKHLTCESGSKLLPPPPGLGGSGNWEVKGQ